MFQPVRARAASGRCCSKTPLLHGVVRPRFNSLCSLHFCEIVVHSLHVRPEDVDVHVLNDILYARWQCGESRS